MAEESAITEGQYFSGNDMYLHFVVEDKDTSALKNLTEFSDFEFGLSKVNSTALKITRTLADGITKTDAAAGKLTVRIPRAMSEPLAGDYYYEIAGLTNAGDWITLAYGPVHINKNIVVRA